MVVRTKIVATLGPASGDMQTLRKLAEAGCDVFRINFSHGSSEQRQQFLNNIRAVEDELGCPLAVLGDLCGPKIRVGSIEGGSFILGEGQTIRIVRDTVEGDPSRISTTLPELIDEVEPAQVLLLNDGKIRLEVTEINAPESITCRVDRGGVLSSGKGINLPDTDLRLSALTEKDRQDAAWIAQRDFDYVALSFVQRADDVSELRKILVDNDSDARIVSKIEKPQALRRIDEIVEVSDAIMVARGDLGVEMDLPAVPAAQKQLATLCQKRGKPCIIATQMLESMTNSAVPTRAEVSDVANAVLDGADAVMLSGETAVGEHPVEAVRMMNDIVLQMEPYHDEVTAPAIVEGVSETTSALAGAVGRITDTLPIQAVGVFSSTGATALMLAKNRPTVPILALSPDCRTVRRMCLYYGVQPRQAEIPEHTTDILKALAEFGKEHGVIKANEQMVVLSGRPLGQAGATNTLVVHTVK
ncbi:MAG: pyruvate kinase [Phycisphaerae bacterium]